MKKFCFKNIRAFFESLEKHQVSYAILEEDRELFHDKPEIDIVLKQKGDLIKILRDYYCIENEHGYFILTLLDGVMVKRFHINYIGEYNVVREGDLNFVPFQSKYKKKNKSFFKYFRFLSKRVITGSGILISLIGPDGSGKTSTSKKLQEMVASNNIRSVRFYFGNKKLFNIVLLDHVYNLVHKYILYLQCSFYRKLGYIVITDRYVYNNTIDYYGNQSNFKKMMNELFFFKMFPSPNLVFFLKGDSKVFFERKGEHNISKLNVMQDKYADLSKRIGAIEVYSDKTGCSDLSESLMEDTLIKYFGELNSYV